MRPCAQAAAGSQVFWACFTPAFSLQICRSRYPPAGQGSRTLLGRTGSHQRKRPDMWQNGFSGVKPRAMTLETNGFPVQMPVFFAYILPGIGRDGKCSGAFSMPSYENLITTTKQYDDLVSGVIDRPDAALSGAFLPVIFRFCLCFYMAVAAAVGMGAGNGATPQSFHTRHCIRCPG